VTKAAFPIEADAESTVDRRRLLCGAGAAAALVVLGEWSRRARERAVPAPGPAVLADPGTLAVGEARALTTTDGRAAVAVRLDAETVVAFDRRCPHLGCPVRWAGARGRFECPCHRAAFDARTGAVLHGPPRTGLTPVTVRRA
jgi:Rieske Fe-S protein